MKPAAYPIRLAIVTVLVISLSGVGFIVSPAAACMATGATDTDRHSPSDCCCTDQCLCGPRCGAPDAPTQGDAEPSSIADGQRLPLAQPMLSDDVVASGSLGDALRPVQVDRIAAEIAPLQTLFDQHTCLRA